MDTQNFTTEFSRHKPDTPARFNASTPHSSCSAHRRFQAARQMCGSMSGLLSIRLDLGERYESFNDRGVVRCLRYNQSGLRR
jgi:hypothetical protein